MKHTTRYARVLAMIIVTAALMAFSVPASAAPAGDLASGSAWSVEGLLQWFQSWIVETGIVDVPDSDTPQTIEGKARVNLDPNGGAESQARVNLDPNGGTDSQARVNLDPNGSD